MKHIDVFNSLRSLGDANKILNQRLGELGTDRADLSELRDIFEKFHLTEHVGLILLHRHYFLNEGEKVVAFGHVSTPWPVPDTAGDTVSGGHLVPRSWRFLHHEPVAYEFGFNHPGQEEYSRLDLPDGFVREVDAFLADAQLDEVLGICAIGAAEVEGRVEKTLGRVNFTVPPSSPSEMDATLTPDYRPSVWSFDCKSSLRDTTIKLARACWVCPKH
ncbi:hypothetical protein MKZ38_006988 [Zalerion maritima]|uniref:Uncharacterized protein n=1 Tax=Zalerion maritima TaxID=339359 RepID=A0AAD5WN67_9PEZI|nr:hypothetical protein MKZ38_006988 [Zalerion maritima]